MATALLAVLVSIVLSHSLPELGRLRHYGWFESWLRGDFNPFAGSGIWAGRHGGWWSIGVPVALLALLQFLLWGQAYGFPSFLLATLLLFYCWGPRDLDADIGAVTKPPTAMRAWLRCRKSRATRRYRRSPSTAAPWSIPCSAPR
jgi:AmpE protein